MLNQEDYFPTKIEMIGDQLCHAANEATELKAEQRLKQILSGASDGLLGELDEIGKKIYYKVMRLGERMAAGLPATEKVSSCRRWRHS